jgi:hypothetical protein
MKTSKLDPHREFILNKLNERTPIYRICKDLVKKGCPVSRSYLTEWIEKSGVHYTPNKRGRPPGTRLFHFLPDAGEYPQFGMAQMFLLTLQKGAPPELMTGLLRQTLIALDLPSYSMKPEQWENLERFADLSDVELLFLTYLRSDFQESPFGQGSQQISDWYCKLAAQAMELREAIKAAVSERANEGGVTPTNDGA